MYIKNYLYACSMISQAPQKILLVSPDYFTYNIKTAATNVFQHPIENDTTNLSVFANREFQSLLDKLSANEIEYYSFKSLPDTPDAVFPNNWFSTHAGSKMVLYPLCADNRRTERNQKIIDFLKTSLGYHEVIDLTHFENQGKFLEGTGSMVIHHPTSTVFAALSPRTDLSLVELFCDKMNFNPVIFNAYSSHNNVPVYHTNVIMSIATNYIVICEECITDAGKKHLFNKLNKLNLEKIIISENQMNAFCGNVIEVINRKGNLITLMSENAYNNFSDKQRHTILQTSDILHTDVHYIEKYGGGSIRCMIAGLH
jgi:hypothetical protein